jgi:drug/metabolite transporter (DMT)-like permease
LTRHLSPPAEPPATRPAIVAALAAIYLFWGATFLALRYAVIEVPPLLTITIRCIGGAVLFYGWLFWRGELERTNPKQWVNAAIAGAFLFVGGHGVLAWAEQRVSSGQAALCMTSIPLWLVLLNSLRERRAPSRLVIAGLVLGVLGVALLVRGNGDWSGPLLQRLSLLGSGLCWAIGSLIARHGARPSSAAQSTAMQLAAGGVAVLALSLLAGELGRWNPHELTLRGALSVSFLVLGGTVIGFGAYTWLLQVTTPAAVGTYAFVNPMVAVTLGLIVGDDVFSTRTIVAGVLVLAAVLLIWRSSTQATRDEQDCPPDPSPTERGGATSTLSPGNLASRPVPAPSPRSQSSLGSG